MCQKPIIPSFYPHIEYILFLLFKTLVQNHQKTFLILFFIELPHNPERPKSKITFFDTVSSDFYLSVPVFPTTKTAPGNFPTPSDIFLSSVFFIFQNKGKQNLGFEQVPVHTQLKIPSLKANETPGNGKPQTAAFRMS